MVVIDVKGISIHGTISKEAVNELGLAVGVEAVAIIKATEVMIALGELKISARNKITGKIAAIKEGAVNSIVSLSIADGKFVSSTISNEAVKELGLKVGEEATAIIKATSVMFGVE